MDTSDKGEPDANAEAPAVPFLSKSACAELTTFVFPSGAPLNTGRMVRGHPSSGQRDRARARARFQRCLKCQLCEGGVGVKVYLNTCVNPRQSAHVALPSPGYSQPWRFLGRRRSRKKRVGGCTQESASAGRDSTGGGANRGDPESHRTCEETGVGRGGVQEWKVECEKELSEAEERLSRLRFETERPMAAVPDLVTEVQRLQEQLAEAQAQWHLQGSVTARGDEKTSCVALVPWR